MNINQYLIKVKTIDGMVILALRFIMKDSILIVPNGITIQLILMLFIRLLMLYVLRAEDILQEALKIVDTPLSKGFFYSKKLNALLDLDVKVFNKAVFAFLKTTDYPVGQLDEFPLVDNEDVLVKADIFQILEDSGVGVPAYYNPIVFEVDGKKGTYNRSRSGCYFCFFQQKIEWVWLYEQHPDLYAKAMEFEKDGYTWNQNESLADLCKPERVRQIKLDAIKRQEAQRAGASCRLIDNLDDDNDAFCANCLMRWRTVSSLT